MAKETEAASTAALLRSSVAQRQRERQRSESEKGGRRNEIDTEGRLLEAERLLRGAAEKLTKLGDLVQASEIYGFLRATDRGVRCMTEREKLEAFIARAGFRHGWKDLESWARRMAERAVEEQDALAARLAEVEKLLRNIEKGLEGTTLELRSSRT